MDIEVVRILGCVHQRAAPDEGEHPVNTRFEHSGLEFA
jgi:hypothetical protein